MGLHKLLVSGALIVAVVLVAGTLRWALTHVSVDPFDGPPNIVLISLDTTRPDHLGCHGYGRPTSPNLDRIAQQGIRFNTARSQFPLTLTSHMSLFTAMLPGHHTVTHLKTSLPTEVPTLAQVLQANGYNTAGLVNNGQMTARWGCDRGFGLWREFDAGLPESKCDNLTAEALKWLDGRRQQPFFLFLHYYDPHLPYDPPPSYREAFGSKLTGYDTGRRCWLIRRPENPMPSPDLLQQLIGSYDGEIAWMDHELGELFSRLPANTLIVLFSDHGEQFKEHGWWGHGASVFEEDMRTVLILQHPTLLPQGTAVDEPVMLVDVMPTVLNLCGIQPPPTCEGLDLSPLWSEGGRLPDRLCFAEAKSTLDAVVAKVVWWREWKLVYSLLDGKRKLYRLPDETTDHAGDEPVVLDTLWKVIREWTDEEDYWTLYAHGQGAFIATVESINGDIPFNFVIGEADHDWNRQWLAESGPEMAPENLRWMRWDYAGTGKSRGLFFQLAPAETRMRFDLQIDGKRLPAKVFIGDGRTHPPAVPWEMGPADNVSDPVITQAFRPSGEGFYLNHHRGKKRTSAKTQVIHLDAGTIEQLRKLGYLR